MTARIVIAGYYGYQNAGDEAILAGMLADLRAEIPDASFTVLSGDPEDTRVLHGVEAVAWTDLPAQVEAVQAASLVIVGGGGLFHDYWGVDPASLLTPRHEGIARYGGPLVLAHLLGKPCMLYGVGVGPLISPEARDLTRDLVSLADAVTVRDQGSKDLLVEIGCSADRIEVTTDPAFSAPPRLLSPEVEAQLAGLGRPLLGVALRHWDIGADPDQWEPAVAEALDEHLGATGGTVLFVPFQTGTTETEDDRRVAGRVHARMQGRAAAVTLASKADALDRFHVIERCDAVLGMRLHAILAAARGRRPFVALAYDRKVADLARMLGATTLDLSSAGADVTGLREQLTLAQGRVAIPSGPHPGTSPADLRRDATLASSLSHSRHLPLADSTPLDRILARRTLEAILEESPRAELDAAEHSAAELRSRFEILQEQRDVILAEKSGVEDELARLRSTIGVRLLGSYWDVVRRVFPDGSPPREVYTQLSLALRALLRGFTPSGDSTASRLIPGPHNNGHLPRAPAQAGPLADLLRFDERIALGQASRIVVIFSPTQLVRDEGQRPTNLALALARRGTPVVFVAWTWGEDEAVAQECAGDEILVLPVDVALRNVTRLLESFDGRERIVVFGFPHPEFSHVLAAANSVGWITVYDAVDDWRAFGHVGQAPWYRETAEQEMTAGVDLVVSVNDRLADRLRAIGRDSVLVLPNGLVEGIDCVDNPLPLKRGAITAGYWGHLTTAWFDWDLVVAAALKEPSWLFYLVGYGDNVRARILPPNVKYLGMQKQNALASIGANLDVGIVPFRRGPVADGADVIKIYEYLAMGLPVVVTGVHPPEGASDHVLRASGVDEFRSMIRQAAGMRHERVEERRAYAQARTWGKRLDTLLEAIDRGDQRIGQKRWLFQESK